MRERGRERLFALFRRRGEKEINKIMVIFKRESFEEFIIIGGLILVQFVYAGNSIILNYLMLMGINPLTIIIFSSLAMFLILSAPSAFFERSKWPKKFSARLLIKIVSISIAGVTLFQILFLKGIALTSPAIATAMPNLAPGLVFFIAAAFRVEKIKWNGIYSKVKISGTLLCVMGAFILSLMQSTDHIKKKAELRLTQTSFFDTQKIIGCIYLVAAVFVLSSNIVLQASTLAEFPAPISLCAITSLFGTVSTTIWELIMHQEFDYGSPVVSFRVLAGYSLLGGIVGGVSVSFTGWAMRKKGPVLVSMFSPIGTVISLILSFLTMGEIISIGSLVSMFLMFSGLYFFLWAKGKEDHLSHEDEGSSPNYKVKHDIEKPLLS